MSSSITIPTPISSGPSHDHNLRNHARHHHRSSNGGVGSASDLSPMSSASSSSSPAASSPSPASASVSVSCCCPGSPSQSLAGPSSAAARKHEMPHQRRPSLLSTAISQQEAHVINIGDPDGPPRLISYLSSSQGFTWNPEIFVPSYVDCDYIPLENRREPVHEIRLSDDEINNMYPK